MFYSPVIVVCSTVATLFLFIFFLRKTILALKTPEQPFNWWSLLLYKQLALVLAAPVFLAVLGVEAFPFFGNRITDEYASKMSWMVLYSVIVFVFSFGVGLRILGLGRSKCFCYIDNQLQSKSRQFTISLLVVALSLMLIGLFLFTHKHALLSALLQGENIREIRGYNAFHSNFPGVITSILAICAWIPAIHAGYEFKNKKYLYTLLFLLAALLLSGLRGDKAPIIDSFTLFGISYFMAAKKKLSAKVFFTMIFGGSFLLILLYQVTKLQFPNQDVQSFLAYLMERLGVSQMAGVYLGINYMDNVASEMPSGFWLNIFPLSGQFVEHPVVAKYIMLELSGRAYDETGVMNSLFISEAFGIGGWGLLFISPIIVGFSMAASIKLIHLFFSKFFSAKIANVYYIPFALLSLNITGGFSQFPLQRVLMINLSVFFLVLIVYLFFNFFKSSIKSNSPLPGGF